MRFKDKVWVYISFLTLVTALIWFGVSLRNTINKPTVPPGIEKLLTPLDPNLDMTVLRDLRQRSIQNF